MYLGYYGLQEPPFSITPDPRFVHLGERHRDALAHLLFGITQGGGGGFVQLTGEVGTGKTTLSRLLLGQLPGNVRVALVLNPRQDPVQLLETVCEELRIDIAGRRGSAKALVDALNAYLLDAYGKGLKVVLLIDEAQNLPADALEQVRLLTNLETDTQKLLQILLLGQPELRAMLARPELRQLAQRITARFHLEPLQADDTARYLRHRWRVAGGERFPFEPKAVRRLHARAGGVPRLINVIAERALLAGYARDAASIDARLVDLAADEVLPPSPVRRRWPWLVAVAVALVLAAAAAWLWSQRQPQATPAIAAPVAPAPAAQPEPPPPPPEPPIDTLDAAALAQLLGATGDTPLPAWQHLLRCGTCRPRRSRSIRPAPAPVRRRTCIASTVGSRNWRRCWRWIVPRCCACAMAAPAPGRCCWARTRARCGCGSANARSISTASCCNRAGMASTRRCGRARPSSPVRRVRAEVARRSTGCATACRTRHPAAATTPPCSRPCAPCSRRAACPPTASPAR